jgi:stearoyl-CoA desaturase (delta-9 desaturase)
MNAPRSASSAPTPLSSRPEHQPDGMMRRHSYLSTVLYWALHAACGLAFFTGVSASDLVLFGATFFVRMFAITGGYHRYFSHRTYKTSRAFQFVLGFLGTSAVQKGPLWWASHHRPHHRFSDQPEDPHSPREGFWHAHQGWIFDGRWDDTRLDQVRDLARYPELVWLNRWHVVAPIALAILCFWIGGLSGLVWGFLISTVATWHCTYMINSLTHRFGRVRYDTGDDSRNSFILALLTLGEGWHNNHHYYQSCTRQGFFWWEIDVTYYILRSLQAVGVVWDIKEPPARVLRDETLSELRKAA